MARLISIFCLVWWGVAVGYDNIGQLTSWAATESNGAPRLSEQLAWTYDKAQDLQSRTAGSLVQTFTVDPANQLTNVTRTGTLTVSGNTPAPATSVTVNGQAATTYGDLTFAATNLNPASTAFTNIAQNTYNLKATNVLTAALPAPVGRGHPLAGC